MTNDQWLLRCGRLSGWQSQTTPGENVTVLELAIRAAREAGELLRANVGRPMDILHKGPIDLVTEVDLASERLIKHLITTYYPRHTVLGEEGGIAGADADAEYRWIV